MIKLFCLLLIISTCVFSQTHTLPGGGPSDERKERIVLCREQLHKIAISMEDKIIKFYLGESKKIDNDEKRALELSTLLDLVIADGIVKSVTAPSMGMPPKLDKCLCGSEGLDKWKELRKNYQSAKRQSCDYYYSLREGFLNKLDIIIQSMDDN
jgi:hypothetical protein